MTDSRVFRDDGPAAALLARVGREGLPVGAVIVAAAGLGIVLALQRGEPTFVAIAAAAAFVVLASVGQARQPPSRTDWLVPPVLRAVEYGGIVLLAAGVRGGAPAAAFALLCAVALHQYDVDHRIRIRGVPPPRTVGHVGLGWDGRLLLMTAAAALGVFVVVALVLAGIFVLVIVAENLVVWRHGLAARGPDGPASLDAGGK